MSQTREGKCQQNLDLLLREYDLKPFAGSHIRAAVFFFKQIQRLGIDILLSQIEVEEEERQIRAIQQKIKHFKEQSKALQVEKKRSSENTFESPTKQFVCQIEQCSRRFPKQSTLKHHSIIVHNTSALCSKGMQVFRIEITEDSVSSQL